MVDADDHVAVAGQFLRPGRVLRTHPAQSGGEQHHGEPFSAVGHGYVVRRVCVGAREAVQQDSGETGVVREGVGDDARLVFRTSEVPGVAGVLAVLAVFAGGIPELGDDRTTVLRCGSGGLGALGVGQLQHAGADREPSRGLGEHRRGQGPGRCGAGGDQREAHHRPRQCEPPRSPARHPPGAPSQQRRHGEGEGDRRAGQHRHHLPAQPEHAEHRPGPHDDDRRRGDGERPPEPERQPPRQDQCDCSRHQEELPGGQLQVCAHRLHVAMVEAFGHRGVTLGSGRPCDLSRIDRHPGRRGVRLRNFCCHMPVALRVSAHMVWLRTIPGTRPSRTPHGRAVARPVTCGGRGSPRGGGPEGCARPAGGSGCYEVVAFTAAAAAISTVTATMRARRLARTLPSAAASAALEGAGVAPGGGEAPDEHDGNDCSQRYPDNPAGGVTQ